MKRAIAALALTAVMLLSAPAASAASLELSVKGPSGSVRAGETFTVTVELSGAAEFCAVQFILAFDQSGLECTEAAIGTILAETLHAENPEAPEGAIIAAVSADPVQTGDGVLGTFHFKAKTDLDSPRMELQDVILADQDGNELDVSVTVGAASDSQTPETKTETPEKPESPETPETPTVPENTTAPEAVPAESTAPSFSDTAGHWAADNIRKAAERGLIGGYADGTFRPNQPVTRKQMAVILWRMAEKPQPTAPAPFTDLGSCGEEFRNAIAWGYETKLLSGTSGTTFSPDAALTRQAAMKLLFGAAGGQAGQEALLYTTYDGAYADSAQISVWAREPVYWGVYNGILSGNGQRLLNPRGTVTRAQLAAILTRYLEQGET